MGKSVQRVHNLFNYPAIRQTNRDKNITAFHFEGGGNKIFKQSKPAMHYYNFTANGHRRLYTSLGNERAGFLIIITSSR